MTEPQPSKPMNQLIDMINDVTDGELGTTYVIEIAQKALDILHPTTNSGKGEGRVCPFCGKLRYEPGFGDCTMHTDPLPGWFPRSTRDITDKNETRSPTTHDVNNGSVDDKAGDNNKETIMADKLILQKDGDKWSCVKGDFINLQESDSWWGGSSAEALGNYLLSLEGSES